MPSTGFYLFLLGRPIHYVPGTWLCQCPQRASTYFFKNNFATIKSSVVCQCPQRASTYFFALYRIAKMQEERCVNALNGLLLISSLEGWLDWDWSHLCQCPQRASTYFFGIASVFIPDVDDMCQCPQRASTYFFVERGINMRRTDMCQCPQRASTYFFATKEMAEQIKKDLCQCPQRASTYFF